jgi:hypothetical protein
VSGADVLTLLKRSERETRKALRLAREVAAAHGVESWAELDWGDLGRFEPAELLADTTAELRAALDELEDVNGAP